MAKKGYSYALTFGMYERLNVHVGVSNFAVIRALRKKLKKSFLCDNSRPARQRRHTLYRAVLKHHKGAGELFRRYRF